MTKIQFQTIRSQFPILKRKVNGHPLAYLDNAATTQKPKAVLDALQQYYLRTNANVHRGVYKLAEEATMAYEQARKTVAEFINADPEEIIFTRGTTESLNLVAYAWGQQKITRNDTILLTEMEHHSNLVPWQQLALQEKATLEYIPVTDEGRLNTSKLKAVSCKLLAVTHVSNVLGTINPIEKLTKWAHERGAIVVIDAAQSAAHIPIDVKKLNCDFLAFSGHKLYGPTGIGVLYGKRALLETMKPFHYGGEMIKVVEKYRTTFNDLPYKFEAGTPNIAGAIGLGAAIEWAQSIGFDTIGKHEQQLTEYALKHLSRISGVTLYGPTTNDRGPAIAFNVAGLHAHDLATLLDRKGIAIRSGHHCAMPLHERLGVPATARASFAIYNSKEEINRLIQGIRYAQRVFRR